MTEPAAQSLQTKPSTGKKSTPIWTRNFFILCLANLTTFISMQMLLPTLPLYLLGIGGTQRDVGYVMGAYTIGAMLMRAVAGWLADRYPRKTVLIVGLVLMLCTTLLYVLADNVPLLTGVRLLHGLTFGLVGTALGAMVADSLPPARMGEGIGYFGLTATLSMAVAPMLGLWITGTYSYHAMFWTTSTLVVVTLLHGIAAKNTAVQRTAPSASFTTIVANLLEKSAILPSIVSFFLTIVYGAVIFFVALYEASLGIGNAGWFFMAMALAMLLFRPVSGYWSDRGGANIVMLIGYVTLFAGIILVCISRSMPVFLAAGVLMGIGFGFCFPILQTIAVRNASAQRRGAATGTYFLAFDIGIGLGGIIWGYVAEATGYKTMFYITLIPLAAAAVLYWRFKSRMGLK